MNGNYDKNIFNKNTGYAFSQITKSTKSNKKYSKVILINIDNFNKFDTKSCLLHFKLRDEEGHIENESYNSIHLILENIVNKEYNKGIDERIISFGKLLKIDTLNEMKKVFKGSEEYMKTIRIVEDLATNPDFIGYYDIEEKRQIDLEDAEETGYDRGIEQGEHNKQIEIAKNMLKEKMDMQIISKITKLSINEIVTLKDSE